MLRNSVALFVAALGMTAWAGDSVDVAFESSPSGASVYIDGRPTGRSTPATLRVPKGECRVAFLKRNYVVSVQKRLFSDTLESPIRADLKPDIEIPYQAQLAQIPDFVEGKREALEFYHSVLSLSIDHFVDKPSSNNLVKESIRALVRGLNALRDRELLLASALSDEERAEYYSPEIKIADYGPLELSVRPLDDGSESWTITSPTSKASLSVVMESGESLVGLLEDFGQVFTFIQENYDRDGRIEEDSLVNLAVRGIFAALGDDYARMIYPVALDDMRSKHQGEFGGLGITVAVRNKQLTVITPIDGTPAFRAGILAGDVITHIEGVATDSVPMEDAVSLMRGAPGSEVSITLTRAGEFEGKTIKLVRAIIPLKFTRGTVLEGDIGYVRLTSFNSKKVAQELEAEIRAVLERGAVGVILDLRDNPGGLLNQAQKVVDLFVDEGVIVSVKGRNKDDVFKAQKDNIGDFPLVVLINHGSASASEIVAGALQDYKRAAVLGETSFGKGSVQMVLPIETYDSAVAITIAKYYLPSGRTIDKHGVDPDQIIALPDQEKGRLARTSIYEKDYAPMDAQIRAAIDHLRTQP